ncbi:uncharacterized protein LOC143042933 [Mytilus galloprovincialis]|uniref:uncharacterized protein LOC143042933 n=1 Tax=Mytilus galloprovincialis TaxID=29158 RepID=UPI003F7BF073
MSPITQDTQEATDVDMSQMTPSTQDRQKATVVDIHSVEEGHMLTDVDNTPPEEPETDTDLDEPTDPPPPQQQQQQQQEAGPDITECHIGKLTHFNTIDDSCKSSVVANDNGSPLFLCICINHQHVNDNTNIFLIADNTPPEEQPDTLTDLEDKTLPTPAAEETTECHIDEKANTTNNNTVVVTAELHHHSSDKSLKRKEQVLIRPSRFQRTRPTLPIPDSDRIVHLDSEDDDRIEILSSGDEFLVTKEHLRQLKEDRREDITQRPPQRSSRRSKRPSKQSSQSPSKLSQRPSSSGSKEQRPSQVRMNKRI